MLLHDKSHVKVQMHSPPELTGADLTDDLDLKENDLDLSDSELEGHRRGEAEFELNESDLMNAIDMSETKR